MVTAWTGRIAGERPGTCGWGYSYDSVGCEAYRTACGGAWRFPCGTAGDNGFVYCPFCGRTIEEVYE